MDFRLPDEYLELKRMVRKFTETELFPLENNVVEREAARGFTDAPSISPEEEEYLKQRTKELGLWGIEVPEEFGGQDLGALAKVIVVEEMNRSIVQFTLPPDAPNLNLLQSCCNKDQYDKYLVPYAKGEKRSALAMTEPNAGSDAAAIQTRAEYKNGKWYLNGTKSFISFAPKVDFFIVIAVSDKEKGKKGGFTAFLVDKGTSGLQIVRNVNTIGDMFAYELVLEDIELDPSQVLGEVGNAFIPLQNRFGVRRMELAARCLGYADRLIQLMIEQANVRTTFGKPLAGRQAVQWWISNSTMELHAARLMVYHAAWKVDQGYKDMRKEAAMLKVYATEMLSKIADRAIQVHGGLGLTKEMPIEYIARLVRVFRIIEGPSEIHRWLLAREILKDGKPYEMYK
ncbi:acyl-CoA dehydrogenase family protein [Paradesulfitobacterium ferrireducens]|uniref:acyl-CoA dehydrogenase family protein n=1 Tax=Paradesulfitobacterium ferrireducens TaxID=2816476 RepID=UPI001A8D8758|nr:acyl-CoA dehydrogenase family protein [Paradesulfitobacterium ferrireducens]